ncbi:MAG TPA: hypothetical protein VFF78_04655 [Anaerolineaceae bacterium]|nr:hypothetical protein [Anaerolineaceae bacterium]
MKKQKIFLALAMVTMLLILSAATFSDAGASISAPSEMSGGAYVLTLHTASAAQPGGYQLVDAGTKVDPAAGCCCKTFMPCINR